MSVPQAPKRPRIFRSVLAEEAWLNEMAAQGQSVTGIKRGKFTFAPVEPGSVRVNVEPCNRTYSRHRVVGPVSAVVLANDPSTRVVNTDGGRLIAVSRVTTQDPLDRLNPLARTAGYRQLQRLTRWTGASMFGLALLLLAVFVWLFVRVLTDFGNWRAGDYRVSPGTTAMLTCLGCFAVVAFGAIVWLGIVAMRSGFAASDRLRGEAPASPTGMSVVRLVGMSAEKRYDWLTEQAGRGWALASWDGWAEYSFEPTAPGQYAVAVEAIGPGFFPVYLFSSATERDWNSPGEALSTMKDAQIVGASNDWLVARRPAELGPLVPPLPLPATAACYAAAADRMRKSIPRTAVSLVVSALLLVVIVALAVFMWRNGSDITVQLLLCFSVALNVAIMTRQLIDFQRRGRALRAWTARYSQPASAQALHPFPSS